MSIAISVLFFFIVLSIASAEAERKKGYLLASMISNLVSTQVFSQEMLKELDISSFYQVVGNDEKIQRLVIKVQGLESKTISTMVSTENPGSSIILPIDLDTSKIPSFKNYVYHPMTNHFYKLGEIAQTEITIQGKQIYQSPHLGEYKILTDAKGKFYYPVIAYLSDFFKVESKYYLYMDLDSKIPTTQSGLPFATITVRLDPSFLVSFYLIMVGGSLIFGILGFIVTGLLARVLSRRIAKPFTVLEARLKSLALEDYETTLHSQIVIKKRPIAEIASVAESTNTILRKMLDFNEMMLTQKNQLEEQRNELENQKEELIESRHMIQEAQSQLVQSQNLASIGQLTAAISHEINDPLDTIRDSVDTQSALIMKLLNNPKVQANQDTKDFITQLGEAASLNHTALDRISSIIKSLKNFSRQDLTEMEETCINESVKSVVLLTSNLWKRRINIIEDYGDIPLIMANPGLVNQVFMNITVNAIHAIPDKGEIHIRTWNDQQYVYVSIRDTGTGIEEGILPYIFDTGFTTKKCGKGSGLGLAICQSVIKKHNGRIEVQSKPGEGTEFTVVLPISMNKAA
ncbi:MAG: HAMP domain-containing histidine kinase [Clostridia bacterium]|nr:HAMP domain-containing histidine kinase [Clostridia bacterium]